MRQRFYQFAALLLLACRAAPGYLDSLQADPVRVLIGSGFGAGIANHGSDAHTLVLQVVYDTGLAGLSALLLFFGVLIARLRAAQTQSARVALNLLAGLWLTSLTTDTFYPVPAFGSFLPLLALTLAIALLPRKALALSPPPPTLVLAPALPAPHEAAS